MTIPIDRVDTRGSALATLRIDGITQSGQIKPRWKSVAIALVYALLYVGDSLGERPERPENAPRSDET